MRHALLLVAAVGCGRVGFDTSIDGAPRDGDGGGDVGDGDGGGAGPAFCATQVGPHALCADFDDPAELPASVSAVCFDPAAPVIGAWSRSEVAGAGTLSLAGGAGRASTNALRAVTGSAIGTCACAIFDPPGLPSRLRLSAFLFLPARPEECIETLGIYIRAPVNGFAFDLELCPAGDALFEEDIPPLGLPQATRDPLGTISVGEWHRFELEVNLSVPRVRVVLDGVERVSRAPTYAVVAGSTSFRVGIDWQLAISGPNAILLDDVVIDAE